MSFKNVTENLKKKIMFWAGVISSNLLYYLLNFFQFVDRKFVKIRDLKIFLQKSM